jgi:hypothetical protein
MTRTRHDLRALAEGVAVHTAVTAAGLGVLMLWARYCDRHVHKPGAVTN